MFNEAMKNLLILGLFETLYMTLVSTVIAYILGLPLGIIMVVTDKEGIFPISFLNKVLGVIINLLRSVPFLILLIYLIPFTRFLLGTTLGSTATIVPLVVGSAPFIARVVESSLKEVDKGVVEAAQSMGASTFDIIFKVLLPEARPSLMIGATIAVTTILSYSAMAGIVGGGGLGAIAINYGLYRYKKDVMTVTVILLVLVVQALQEIGMKIAKTGDKRIN